VGDSSSSSDLGADSGANDSSQSTTDGTVFEKDTGVAADAGPGTPCSDLPWPGSGSIGVVQGVSSPLNEFNVTLTGDALTMFFARNATGGIGVFEAVRDASTSFGSDTQVADIATALNGGPLPNISADGLTMYVQYRSGADGGTVTEGGVGNADAAADLTFNIYTYNRSTTSSPWIGPTQITGINTSATEAEPFISADDNTLYFVSDRAQAGVFLIYQATKTSPGVFTNVTEITGLAAAGTSVQFPVMNAASTKLFYNVPQSGASSQTDIYMVQRPKPDAPFGAPTRITQLSTPTDDRPGYISPDECRFYFTTKTGSTANDFDIWLSRKK
jgi:hypothetical protein